jgi:hypothetical protein
MSNTTFNPSDKSANIVLSNGNHTYTQSSSGEQGVRTVLGVNTGKFYTETNWDNTPSGTDTGAGFCTAGATLTSLGSTVTNACIAFKSGSIWVNGSSPGNVGGAFAINDKICCAIDLVNSKVWFRKNGGNWNNSGTADPATNTGGFSISGFQTNNSTVMHGCGCVNVSADTLTSNFGDTSFSFTVPSGFQPGLPGTVTETSTIDMIFSTMAQAVTVTVHFGTLAVTEGTDTFAGTGDAFPGLVAGFDGLETSDIFDGAGYADIVGPMVTTEAGDVFHGILVSPKNVTFAITETKDIFSGIGFVVGISGLFATTEPVDRMTATGFIKPKGPLVATELADRFSARAPGVVTIIRRLISVN